jgi:hypothetical protein
LRALRELAEERWNIPLAGWWLGRGDIDHLVRARSGVGYARSRRFDDPHLVQAGDTARAVLRVGRRGGLVYQHGSAIVVPRIVVT